MGSNNHEDLRDGLIRALCIQKAGVVRGLLGLVEVAPSSVDDSIADAFAVLGDVIDNWAELEAIKEVERMEANRAESVVDARIDAAAWSRQMLVGLGGRMAV